MQAAYQQFCDSIRIIQEIEALHDYLNNTLKLPNDLSDLRRLKIVYAVSAFDTLMHELTRIGMLDSFNGIRSATPKYETFSLNLKVLDEIIKAAPPATPAAEQIFDREIRLKHSHLAFQEPEKVSDALSHFWNEGHKWQKIAVAMGLGEEDCKRELKLIAKRRNQIVHEFDYDFFANARRSITHAEAQRATAFIEKLGAVIFNLVK